MKEFIHILALVFIAKGFVSGGKAIYYFYKYRKLDKENS